MLGDTPLGLTIKMRARRASLTVVPKYCGTLVTALLHVATSNAIPTAFGLLANIITRSELVSQLRDGCMDAVDHSTHRVVNAAVHELASKFPLLASCYREAIRLSNNT
jgi:hypothetical protein